MNSCDTIKAGKYFVGAYKVASDYYWNFVSPNRDFYKIAFHGALTAIPYIIIDDIYISECLGEDAAQE
ncbi:MAG: hypothetical protein RLN62_03010 [Rickettsiales bacterium]